MLLVIHGSDSYFVHRKLRQAVEKAQAKHGAGATELPADTSDLGAAREALRGGSLLSEQTVVVFRDWFREKPAEQANELAELLEMVPADSVAIVAEHGEVDGRRKAFKRLTERADKAWRFDTLDEPAAANWLVKRAAAAGKTLPASLARRLVSAVGTDGWTLATELDKLQAAAGDEITAELIDELVSSAAPATIWQLVDAIGAEDFSKAQTALRSLLASGEPAQRIFAMVVRQYRILLGVVAAEGQGDAAVAKQLGVHPYGIRQVRRQAGRFTEEQLRGVFSDLLAQDLAVKRGRRDATEALELFVADRTVRTAA